MWTELLAKRPIILQPQDSQLLTHPFQHSTQLSRYRLQSDKQTFWIVSAMQYFLHMQCKRSENVKWKSVPLLKRTHQISGIQEEGSFRWIWIPSRMDIGYWNSTKLVIIRTWVTIAVDPRIYFPFPCSFSSKKPKKKKNKK